MVLYDIKSLQDYKTAIKDVRIHEKLILKRLTYCYKHICKVFNISFKEVYLDILPNYNIIDNFKEEKITYVQLFRSRCDNNPLLKILYKNKELELSDDFPLIWLYDDIKFKNELIKCKEKYENRTL